MPDLLILLFVLALPQALALLLAESIAHGTCSHRSEEYIRASAGVFWDCPSRTVRRADDRDARRGMGVGGAPDVSRLRGTTGSSVVPGTSDEPKRLPAVALRVAREVHPESLFGAHRS